MLLIQTRPFFLFPTLSSVVKVQNILVNQFVWKNNTLTVAL